MESAMELSYLRMCSADIQSCSCMHSFQMVLAKTFRLFETNPPMLLAQAVANGCGVIRLCSDMFMASQSSFLMRKTLLLISGDLYGGFRCPSTCPPIEVDLSVASHSS